MTRFGFGARGGLRLLVVVGCVLGGWLVLGGSVAGALVFSGQLTGLGSPAGVFGAPRGVAVDTRGDVYVLDASAGAEAVLEFAQSGGYLNPQPLTGTEDPLQEAFDFPKGIAVDNSAGSATGDVYVTDELANMVDQFKPEPGRALTQWTGSGTPFGEFDKPWGVAVDMRGDVYVADFANDAVEEFSAGGVYLSPQPLTGSSEPLEGTPAVPGPGVEPFGTLRGVAVDGQGDVYVADIGADAVDEFSASGVLLSQLRGVPSVSGVAVPGAFGRPQGLAVDAQGDVYVADSVNKTIDEFSPSGVFLGQLTGAPATAAVPGPFGEPTGVAVDPEGYVYVADDGLKVIDEFSPVSSPQAVARVVSVNTGTSATLNGTLNPRGQAVGECRFEYVPGSVYEAAVQANAADPYSGGASVPCAQSPQSIGSGSSPVAVSTAVQGLAPNTGYDYRLVTVTVHQRIASTAHQSGVSGNEPFKSAALAPLLTSQPASGVTQSTATLTGAVDARNAPVGYHFAYVQASEYEPGAPDPYQAGAVIPDPDIYAPVSEASEPVAAQTLTGLKPGTTYDYALVASGPGGTTVSADQTFTTALVPLPVVSTGGVGAVSEGAATLTGSIDPQGSEATYLFQYGTSMGYGQSWPTVAVALGGLEGRQAVAVFLENLQPDTVYHYRLVATNAAGTEYGGDGTFATGGYPVSVVLEAPVLATKLAFIAPEVSAGSAGKPKAKGKTKRTGKRGKKTKGRRKVTGKHKRRRGGRRG